MNLEYSQKVELLHSLLVAIGTVFPYIKVIHNICIVTKNICAKYEIKILSCYQLIAQFFCCQWNIV